MDKKTWKVLIDVCRGSLTPLERALFKVNPSRRCARVLAKARALSRGREPADLTGSAATMFEALSGRPWASPGAHQPGPWDGVDELVLAAALGKLPLTIREELIKTRFERGMTQRQAAIELNVPDSRYSDWERGVHHPSPVYREKIEAWIKGGK